MIIDSLPTGSVFSFLWNMLVSVSFQFVGFLLTYLLHTTHAARLGSRAGLGITLIQYGFALRGKLDEDSDWQTWRDPARPPPFTSGGDSDPFVGQHRALNFTSPTATGPVSDDQGAPFMAGATTEWLSFFLMTVGECRFHSFANFPCQQCPKVGSFCLHHSLVFGGSRDGNVAY